MNQLKIFLISVLLFIPVFLIAQTHSPFLQETFEGYTSGLPDNVTTEAWKTCELSGASYNKWIVDSVCTLTGNKSMVVTSHLMTECTYEDGDYNHAGSVIVYSKKLRIDPVFKNVSLVFNWKSGGNSSDYGMLAYSLSGNYNAASYWTNVTNIYDGVANGKYYNRLSEEYASANMKAIATGDSVRIAFRWINNQNGNINAPGWIVDNLVLCALGEISSSLGDTIAPGLMTRLVITGYTGTVIQWERYTGGQWVYLAGNTDSYTTPIILAEGVNKFRVKIQNGILQTYSEKDILVSSEFSIIERNAANECCTFYPNPGSSLFTVSNPSGKTQRITLTDSKGAVVYSFVMNRGENKREINLSFLPADIYYASSKDAKHLMMNKIVIVK